MKRQHLITCFFLILLTVCLKANETVDSLQYLTSDEIIDKGIKLHNDGKYDDAIKLYDRISQVDPKYSRACYEKSLSLYYLNRNEEALAKCQEALSLKFEVPHVYSLIGSLLDVLGKPLEGAEFLLKALEKFPYNQNILYNLALCYYNSNQIDKAESTTFKSILINPYHFYSHLLLAKANYAMGRVAQSYLAYSMALLLRPTNNNISEMESAISNRLKIIPKPYLYSYKNAQDSLKWSKLKWILNSELAFNKEFDYDSKLNYTIPRQLSILFQNMSFDQNDTSLYNQLYVRLFSDICSQKKLDIYFYYIFRNLELQDVIDWYKKNRDVNDAFVDQMQKILNERREYGFNYKSEKEGKQFYHFSSDNLLSSIGEISDNKKKGPWIIIDNNGLIEQTGNYVNDNKEGEWLMFYDNKTIKQKLQLRNDKFNGHCYIYYPNGQISSIYPMLDGLKNGILKKYTSSGRILSEENYVNDTLSGPAKYFFYKDAFKSEAMFANDSLDGKKTETWLNGIKKAETGYKKGLLHGSYKTWYKNAILEKDLTFNNDQKSGKWISYYPNGTKKTITEYDENGELTGNYYTYDNSDKIKSLDQTYNKGILNGTDIHYFPDGKIQEIHTYKNDTLVMSECFNNKGKQIYKTELINDVIKFKDFYPDGIIFHEGELVKNKKEGLWKTYNPLGLLIEELNYRDGMQSGTQKKYYANQKIKEIYQCDSDRLVDKYISYFSNGHPKIEGQYDKDGKKGEWITRYINDSINIREFYKEDQKAGVSIIYNQDGTLNLKEFFNSDGESIRIIKYKPVNLVAYDINYEYGEFKFIYKYPDNKTKTIVNIRDNQLDGVQEEYYPNGQKESEKNYISGNINGIYSTWDYNGDTLLEMHYNLGIAEGKIRWFKNGKLEASRTYEYDLAQGKRYRFHNNGQVSCEANEVDDRDEGYAYYYAPDGTVMYRLLFVNDILKGYSYQKIDKTYVDDIIIDVNTTKLTAYYPNGNISFTTGLKYGLYSGAFVSYYSNGKILTQGSYSNDVFDGNIKRYFPSGTLQESTNYLMGEKNGLYTLYYENGKIKKSGTYSIDECNDEWTVYNSNGAKTEKLLYSNGLLYEIKKY